MFIHFEFHSCFKLPYNRTFTEVEKSYNSTRVLAEKSAYIHCGRVNTELIELMPTQSNSNRD